MDFLISFYTRVAPSLKEHWDFVVMILGFLIMGFTFYRTNAPRVSAAAVSDAPAPTAAPVDEPRPQARLVSSESVERLREAYHCWGPTIQLAIEQLYTDIFLSGNRADPCQNFITKSIERYILPKHARTKDELEQALAERGPVTEDRFAQVLDLFRRTFLDYIAIVAAIKEIGAIFHGEEQLHAHEGFRQLARRHTECMDELRRLRGRSDTRAVANLIYKDLEELFPKLAS